MEKTEESWLRLFLKKLAKRECWCDGSSFCPNEDSGGNYDDTYSGGFDDGQAKLARQILDEFFNESKERNDSVPNQIPDPSQR